MPDAMDRVQQFAVDRVDDALARHHDRPQLPGRSMCANLDCGEPISEFRRQGGAQLCLACQRAEEAQAAHFRRWGCR